MFIMASLAAIGLPSNLVPMSMIPLGVGSCHTPFVKIHPLRMTSTPFANREPPFIRAYHLQMGLTIYEWYTFYEQWVTIYKGEHAALKTCIRSPSPPAYYRVPRSLSSLPLLPLLPPPSPSPPSPPSPPPSPPTSPPPLLPVLQRRDCTGK